MGVFRTFGLALMLAGASVTPAYAQDTSASSDSAPAEDKMAVATRIADKIMPEGSYAQTMTKSVLGEDGGEDSLFFQIYSMPAPPDEEKKMSTGKTLLDLMEEQDPYIRERLTIMTKIFAEELLPIFMEMEPLIRDGLARHLSKSMSFEELTALEEFLNTPAGAKFASQLLPMWTSPEMAEVQAEIGPALMDKIPLMLARFEEETSHLPKPESYEDDEDYYEGEEAEAAAE